MFSMLKRMSILRSEEYDFEKLIGRLDKLMEHEGVMKAGWLSVRQRGFRGDPMSRVPLLKKPLLLPDGISNFRQLDRSYDDLDARVCRNAIEPRELEELERFAANQGVATMGYTKVDPDNIFIDRGILFDRAIVISLEMPADKVRLAPSYETLRMIERTYARTGIVVNRLAECLRTKGFGAQAGPGLGGFTVYPVLAAEAGMGLFGRSGLLLTPENGPSHRLAVVYTNIDNLPVRDTHRHDWIADYCAKCGVCIKTCPAGAIYETPLRLNEKHIAHIDYDRCMPYFADNYGCSVCVKECPFFKSGYRKLHERHSGSLELAVTLRGLSTVEFLSASPMSARSMVGLIQCTGRR